MIIKIPFGPGIFRVPKGARRLLVSDRRMIDTSTINIRAIKENTAMISDNVGDERQRLRHFFTFFENRWQQARKLDGLCN
jgi:hypothetical protein